MDCSDEDHPVAVLNEKDEKLVELRSRYDKAVVEEVLRVYYELEEFWFVILSRLF